jgi:hypothetical protein
VRHLRRERLFDAPHAATDGGHLQRRRQRDQGLEGAHRIDARLLELIE